MKPARQWSGEEVGELRRKLGYTVNEFAYLLGVDPSTVWKWETGKSRPRSLALRRLLARLEKGGKP